MKIVTAQEMREIDRRVIEEIGIPGAVLMENAGVSVFNLIRELTQGFPPSSFRVTVFVGRGNNGGDGLVVSRHLHNFGYRVTAYLLAPPDAFSGDAALNLEIARKIGVPIKTMLSEEDLDGIWSKVEGTDVVVDAIFGTGLKGPVRGLAGKVIERVNRLRAVRIAVDLPSGLNADTGAVEGPCVRADFTVTMALPKRGLFLHPGADYCGEVRVAHIGFPNQAIESQGIKTELITGDLALSLLPSRPASGHKGTFGHVLVIAGSLGLTGAATLTSLAALRSGAGMVTLGIPESLNSIMEVKLTEVMTLPLPETSRRALSVRAMEGILEFMPRATVLAIGPGLSQDPETVELVWKLCFESTKPMVIDADGLNAIAQNPEILDRIGPDVVLTPHPGEMSRLTSHTVKEIESNRIEAAKEFALKHGLTLVLKGAPTIVAAPDGKAYVNSTGNPGMASAGMGDVLTGLIAGLMAQGMSPTDAAISAVFYHGLAADKLVAEGDISQRGLIAGDVLEMCGKIIGERANEGRDKPRP
jgi:NAD(P)H-hydrate epimerase